MMPSRQGKRTLAFVAFAMLLFGASGSVSAFEPDDDCVRALKLLSMNYLQQGQMVNSAEQDEILLRLKKLRTSEFRNQAVLKLQGRTNDLMTAYTYGFRLWNYEPFTELEKIKMAKDAFLSGFQDDNERKADVLGKALEGMLKKEAAKTAGGRMLFFVTDTQKIGSSGFAVGEKVG